MEENLGPNVPWQIRDIPQQIRDMVVEQARIEGVKVPELVTRLVLDAQANGWTFAGSNLSANPSNTADPARLRAAVGMVIGLAQAGVPVQKGVAAVANRLVKRELLEVQGPRSGRALTGPAAISHEAANGEAAGQ
jgi:hypothetical protein